MRGILFKPDLLAKILAGEKTVTRRTNLAWAKVRKGDRLYAKEGLREDVLCGREVVSYASDGAKFVKPNGNPMIWPWKRAYLSPLHMPAACARTFLIATEDARTERLLDITEADAVAEGVVSGIIPPDDYGPERIGYVLGVDDGKCPLHPTPQTAFLGRWYSQPKRQCEDGKTRFFFHHDPLGGGGMRLCACDICNPLVAVVTFKLETRQ